MEDRTGNIWFAAENKGVFRYDGKAIENIIDKEGLGDNYAGGMIQDKEENYWFTIKGGITKYDGSIYILFQFMLMYTFYSARSPHRHKYGCLDFGMICIKDAGPCSALLVLM